MCRPSRLPCCSYRDAYLVFSKWSVRHLWFVLLSENSHLRCSDSSPSRTWCLLAPLTKYTKRFTQFAAWWLAWAALNFHYVTTAFGYRTQNNLFIPKMLLFSLNLFIFKFSFGYTTKIIDSDTQRFYFFWVYCSYLYVYYPKELYFLSKSSPFLWILGIKNNYYTFIPKHSCVILFWEIHWNKNFMNESPHNLDCTPS